MSCGFPCRRVCHGHNGDLSLILAIQCVRALCLEIKCGIFVPGSNFIYCFARSVAHCLLAVMAAAPEGSQYDTRQFDAKMNEL